MISRLIRIIIKSFGIDEKQNQMRIKSSDFVYEKDSKIFWYLKNFLYLLILIVGISYIIIYVNLENSRNFVIPESKNNFGDYLNEAWIFILFGIIYILYSLKFLKNINKHRDIQTHPNTYKNFKNSFSYSFWYSMIIICLIRIILAFTIENLFLNTNNALALSAANNNYSFYIANIFFILSITLVFIIMIFSLVLSIIKPKIIKINININFENKNNL